MYPSRHLSQEQKWSQQDLSEVMQEIISKDALKPFGIKSEFYHLEEESRSCINIWDEVNHVQTEFLEPGFTVSEEEFEGFEKHFTELVKKADVVAMSGSVPKGLDGTAYQRLVRICKEAGKKVILDTSGKLLEMGIEQSRR